MGTGMVDLLELGFIVVYSFVDVVICKTGRWMMDSLEMFFYNLFLEEKDFTKCLPLDMASLCDPF